jgi:hypothetical protein
MAMEDCTGAVTECGKMVVYYIGVSGGVMAIHSSAGTVTESVKLSVY